MKKRSFKIIAVSMLLLLAVGCGKKTNPRVEETMEPTTTASPIIEETKQPESTVQAPTPAGTVEEPTEQEWYRKGTVYQTRDKKHTFQISFVEEKYYQVKMDEKNIIGKTEQVDKELIEDGYFYEIKSNQETFDVIYYYKEDTIEIIDCIEDGIDYSELYYPIS